VIFIAVVARNIFLAIWWCDFSTYPVWQHCEYLLCIYFPITLQAGICTPVHIQSKFGKKRYHEFPYLLVSCYSRQFTGKKWNSFEVNDLSFINQSYEILLLHKKDKCLCVVLYDHLFMLQWSSMHFSLKSDQIIFLITQKRWENDGICNCFVENNKGSP